MPRRERSAQRRGCSVEGCDRPHRSKGLCNSHYFRVYRGQDVGGPDFRARTPDAKCRVEDCASAIRGGSNGYCPKHVTRRRRHGDPATVLPRPSFPREQNPNWLGEECGYRAVHERLRTTRGPASLYTCACGAQAKHWAYDHCDPDERIAENGAFSVDPARYEAKCVPCHKRYDLDRIAGTRAFGGAA